MSHIMPSQPVWQDIPPLLPRGAQSAAIACGPFAKPDEDWTKISDPAERRKVQNRIAQRKYRKNAKRRHLTRPLCDAGSDTKEPIKERPIQPRTRGQKAAPKQRPRQRPVPTSPSASPAAQLTKPPSPYVLASREPAEPLPPCPITLPAHQPSPALSAHPFEPVNTSSPVAGDNFSGDPPATRPPAEWVSYGGNDRTTGCPFGYGICPGVHTSGLDWDECIRPTGHFPHESSFLNDQLYFARFNLTT